MAELTLEELVVKFSANDKELRNSISGLERKIKRLDNEVDTSTSNIEAGFKKVKTAIQAAIPVLLLAELVRSTSTVTMQFEDLQSTLKTVEGSAYAASEAFDQIQEFATTTPFQLEEVVDSYIKLRALGLEPSEKAMLSYGNTASAMGKSLNQMIEAVADASVGEFERLKEFGIKAKSEGEDVVFTFQGLSTRVGKNADEIQGYLTDIGENQFAGSMAEKIDNLSTKVSNASDSFARLGAVLGDGILGAGMKSTLDGITAINDALVKVLTWDVDEGSLADRVGFMTSEERKQLEKQKEVYEQHARAQEKFLSQMAGLNNTGESGASFVDLHKDFMERVIPENLESNLEKLRTNLLSQEEELRIHYERNREIAQEAFENQLIQEEEHNEIQKQIKAQYEPDLTAIEDREAKKRQKLEGKHSKVVTNMKRSVVNEAVSLLNILGAKSKGAALVALAVQKGLAIAETIVNTQVASMRALAELGPIAGPPVAASIQTLGATKVGLIAATGLLQASTMGGGGSSIGGSYSGTTGTSTTNIEQSTGQVSESSEPVTVNVNIPENALLTGEGFRAIIDGINEQHETGYTLAVNRG